MQAAEKDRQKCEEKWKNEQEAKQKVEAKWEALQEKNLNVASQQMDELNNLENKWKIENEVS